VICAHEQLTADVKATLLDKRYYLCVRASCLHCSMFFEVVSGERSADGRQLKVELRPSAELVSDISRCEH
jgi:hypothetical protein